MQPLPQAVLPACPAPLPHRIQITLAHGGGGRLTQDLIDDVFRPAFASAELDLLHDGAILGLDSTRLAFTTDTHVVTPLFFPGGDIGKLAVNGTVNDLAMCGARPRWLSAGFILEEGLPTEILEHVVHSMQIAARATGVSIVTGDTKVVERGKADGMYITTAGVGVIEHPEIIAPSSVRTGDAVLLSGDIGRHGMAIMAKREGLAFESPIESDCAPLVSPVMALLDAGIEVHCLRDLTRGGLATALVEIAESSRLCIAIDENCVPVTEAVRGACELLGFEPMYVANEGRMVCFVAAREAEHALDILSRTAPGGPPAMIGYVRPAPAGRVTVRSIIGAERIVDRLSGEQLPRIC